MGQEEVRLGLALYGHPDSGGYWEKEINKTARKGRWRLVDNGPSVLFHPELRLVLVVCVDDFTMRGPRANIKAGWASLRGEIKMGDPEPFGRYLGCEHQILGSVELCKLAKAFEIEVPRKPVASLKIWAAASPWSWPATSSSWAPRLPSFGRSTTLLSTARPST